MDSSFLHQMMATTTTTATTTATTTKIKARFGVHESTAPTRNVNERMLNDKLCKTASNNSDNVSRRNIEWKQQQPQQQQDDEDEDEDVIFYHKEDDYIHSGGVGISQTTRMAYFGGRFSLNFIAVVVLIHSFIRSFIATFLSRH
jgi:hypothetical protein